MSKKTTKNTTKENAESTRNSVIFYNLKEKITAIATLFNAKL